MKKNFIALGLIAAAAFTLTNCTKEIENPSTEPESAGIPFEITASTPDTKTANADLATNWVADDLISVFHVETGSTEFVTNDPFTITEENISNNKFTGTLTSSLEAGKSYDWYVMYPYKSAWKPNTTSGGVVYLGSKYNEVQTQNGNDSKSHLAGSNVPFAGKATDVEASSAVNITMEHLAAVIEITVNNSSGEDLTVSSVTFTAPESIIGGHYISIVDAEPVYTPNGSYVNEIATLTVVNADPIASGSSAKYYLAIKPFDATEGQELKLSVNGYEKSLPLPKNVSFEAGKIKPLTFKYDKVVGQSIPYSETFNNTQGLFSADDKVLPAELTYVWKTNSGYIKASAYKSANYAAESWLISPYLDLTEAESAYMSFEHCGNYFTDIEAMQDEVKVKVRKHGGDWSDVAVEYPESLGWDFVHSGFISLESYLGSNVQVAFVYTSTASKAGTWEVKNFKVDIKKDQFLSFSTNSASAEIGSEFSEPVLSGAKTTVSYNSSDTGVATVASDGTVTLQGAGTTTITATAASTAEYYESTASYTLLVTGNNSRYYVKVTETPDNWNGSYLIVYENSAEEVFVFNATDAAGDYISAPLSANGIIQTAAVDAESVSIEEMTGGYAIKTKNGYIYGVAGNNNALKFNTNTQQLNTITFEDGNCIITNNGVKLAFYSSGASSRFRYYGKSTQKSIQLYKLED